MNYLAHWVHSPAAAALVWTLAHSLWQGALVAIALSIALRTCRGSRARYAAACAAMLLILGVFAATFAIEYESAKPVAHPVKVRLAPRPGPAPNGNVTAAPSLASYTPWLAPLWIAGVIAFHLRTLASWIAARRLRRTGVCAAPPEWQRRLAQLAAQLAVRAPVRLLESALAEVPVVIGWLRPVILIPVGLLAGLPPTQVEALLLHELAHIRRHDYLVNLLQVFVEGLLFYHPAVWWTASVIRAERENCCDDLVVATHGDAHEYCTALASLEQARATAIPALAANGGSLVKRIRRLLAPETPRSALTPVVSAAVLLVTAVGIVSAWQQQPKPAVEGPYRKWLAEDVAYIITDAERAAFKALPSDEEREHFIDQFWLRRDPTPGTPANEFKEEHYRRIAYANEHYSTPAGLPGWKTDRGRVYISYGPPNEKETHPAGGAGKSFPYEQWLYDYIDGVGTRVIVEFDDPNANGEFRMTMDPNAKAVGMVGPPRRHASVQVLGGMAAINIPLADYAGHPVHIYGRVMTQDGHQVTTFEENATTTAANFVKSIPLPPGAGYRIELVIKDAVVGGVYTDTAEFTMRW